MMESEAILDILKVSGYCAVAWLLAPYFWAAFRWAVVDPADALLHKLKSLPPVPRFLAVLVLCVSIVFGDKPSTNGTDGLNAPLPPMLQMRQMVGDPPPADEPSALAITAFSKSTNGVGFAMDWIPGLSLACLDLLYSEHLDTNDWNVVDRWAVSPTQTNDMRFVSFGGSFTNAVSGFFGLRGYTYDADPDGDRLSVGEELRLGTDPFAADTEDDGLSDFEEACGFEQASSSNWIDYRMFPEGSLWNFAEFRSASGLSSAGRIPLSNAVHRLDRTFTACAVDPNGLVHLYESSSGSAVYQHSENWDLSESPVDVRAFTIAPFWTALEFGTQSVVRVFGRSSQFLVVEFDRMCLAAEPHVPENEVSVQVMMPLAASDYIAVCYYRGIGALANSRAVIGYRAPGTSARTTYSYLGSRPVSSDCVGFRACLGTDPCSADSDNDGLSDGEEVSLMTDPNRPDTDADGIPDGWEFLYGLDPLDADDSTLDSDGDGLTNIGEYQNGCDPGETDTDGDGTDDATEVAQGSDPSDSQDGGVAPPAEAFRELAFNIYGDYAAWELTVEGLGPQDRRMRHVTMTEPDVQQDVKLKLRKGNAYRLSMHWLNCDGHSDCYRWYCWQTRIDGLPAAKSYDDYSSARLPGNEIVSGPGWIAENAGGLLTAHVHEHDPQASGYGGGNVAEGLTATLYVLDDPRLVPDYDRDGEIGETDAALARQGKVFRFWINDDNDAASPDGDIARGGDDYPVNGLDWNDGHVNGRRDLVDLTPVWADATSTLAGVPASLRSALTFRLRQQDGALNAVWTALAADRAGAFQTNDCGEVFGNFLSAEVRSADAVRVEREGTSVPVAFADVLRATDGRGVFLFEGRQATAEPLWLEVCHGDRVVCSNALSCAVSPVEQMYRWLNVRHLSGGGETRQSALSEPTGRLDSETSDRHLVLLHGVNVGESGARAWGAEIFKRLWQTGFTAKFTGVCWRSDIGSDANYQQNASNAFEVAASLAPLISALPGEKVLMAHSLGNMVCSSMIQDYGLQVSKYLMCDSAVPSEAYCGPDDESIRVPQLLHPNWEAYPTNTWASNWHKHFRDIPGDDRKFLGWPGRFPDVPAVAVNFYSTGDEVLELNVDNDVDILSGVDDGLAHMTWHKQEMFKGRAWFEEWLGTTRWSGWGFNVNRYAILGVMWPITAKHYTPEQAAGLTSAQIRSVPVFNPYPTSLTNTTSMSLLVRAAHLTQGIPALSPPTGGTSVQKVFDDGEFFNLNLNSETGGILKPHGWPTRSTYPGRWLHSDMKDVAFYYNYKFYEKVAEKGNLK